ncbi:MAG: YraN family protein [Bacteroidia bacterium]|nr:YraN family protein [Bacteroidia bacterium]MCX7651258.1 YraN family protein [Bacteroidia bacterium]MDW8416206.1 YraN family protein [Bacteroidia bacterium]
MAADFLRSQGYKVLYQRWRKGNYEIDIVAWQDGELVFVEVRTVSQQTPWNPESTIRRGKQSGIRRSVEIFFTENPVYESLPARIDVVAVRLSEVPEVVLFVDAFR